MTNQITQTDLYKSSQLLLGIGLGMVIYALLSELAGSLTLHHFHSTLLKQLWILFVKVWLPAAIVSPLVIMGGLRFPFIPQYLWSALAFHVTLFLCLAFTHSLLLSYHYYYFANMNTDMQSYEAWQHMGHFLFGDALILFDFIIYTLLVASINLRHFYSIAQAKDVETRELNNQLTRTRLQALRMQINPHFLFNTLNAISVLIMKQKNAQAVGMIGRLSHLFRQSLDENQLLTSLEKELDTATQYLGIEQVRFGDRLKIEVEYSHRLLNAQVPSMLLQPLLENAIRHGLSKREGDGRLRITCTDTGDSLVIEIADNGVGFDADLPIVGIGIDNIRQRLMSHFGVHHSFGIQSEIELGTTITVKIPLVFVAVSV